MEVMRMANAELERTSKLKYKYAHMEQTPDNQLILKLLKEYERKLVHKYNKEASPV